MQLIAFNRTMTLLAQYPKEYRVMIMPLIPNRGPKYEMIEGAVDPRKLKKMIVANESHHPRPNSIGPRAPVAKDA